MAHVDGDLTYVDHTDSAAPVRPGFESAVALDVHQPSRKSHLTLVSGIPQQARQLDRPDETVAPQEPVTTLRPAPEPLSARRSAADLDRRRRVDQLLIELTECTNPVARGKLQSKIVVEHQGVARSIAARYRNRGVERDDLEQLAYLGLIKAVMRWKPGLSENFLQFAVPTIAGEIKRYFRDHSLMVRPPRRIQELRAALAHVDFQSRGNSVGRTDDEVGASLGVSAAAVREARQAVGLCHPRSLDAPGLSGHQLADTWGAADHRLGEVEDRIVVQKLIRTLSDRERSVVRLRFAEGLSQAQIGAAIGVSQMQVSRLIRGIMARLQELLIDQ